MGRRHVATAGARDAVQHRHDRGARLRLVAARIQAAGPARQPPEQRPSGSGHRHDGCVLDGDRLSELGPQPCGVRAIRPVRRAAQPQDRHQGPHRCSLSGCWHHLARRTVWLGPAHPGYAGQPVARARYWRASHRPTHPGDREPFQSVQSDVRARDLRSGARHSRCAASPSQPYDDDRRGRSTGSCRPFRNPTRERHHQPEWRRFPGGSSWRRF